MSTVYRKSENDRTTHATLPDSFSVIDEYRAAKRLYEENPEVFVKPHYIECDRNQKGYVMEEASGEMLFEYMGETAPKNRCDLNLDLIYAQLWDAVDAIQTSGQPHGDLSAHNVIVEEDEGVTIIDPIGIPPDHPLAEEIISRDENSVAKIMSQLGFSESPRPELLEPV